MKVSVENVFFLKKIIIAIFNFDNYSFIITEYNELDKKRLADILHGKEWVWANHPLFERRKAVSKYIMFMCFVHLRTFNSFHSSIYT